MVEHSTIDLEIEGSKQGKTRRKIEGENKNRKSKFNDTRTILLKTLLITTLHITLTNATSHIYFFFTIISKVIYKENQL